MRPQQFSDEQLLSVARDLFIKEGPQASIESIAEALGVTQAAIFKRYKTKKLLLLHAFVPKQAPQWVQKLKNGPDDRPIEQQLEDVLKGIFSFFKKIVPMFTVLKFSGIEPNDILKAMDEPFPVIAIKELSLWLEKAHQKGLCSHTDFRAAAIGIIGSAHTPIFLKYHLGIDPLTMGQQNYIRVSAQNICNGLGKGVL
jgi:AcrR family transcriptional regulator